MKLIDIIREEIPEGKFWTDRLHLVSGCSAVSPGCANCWMVAEARLRENHPLPGVRALHEGLLSLNGKHFNGTVRFNAHLLEKAIPKSNRRAPRAWAVWTDLFHEELFNEHITAALDTFQSVPTDYFIVVTKRARAAYFELIKRAPIPNVIVLVTMEDQHHVDLRSPWALWLAANGWNVGVLAEPLLTEIVLPQELLLSAKWIITGGESGHRARPASVEWFCSLRDQAIGAKVPFLFKGYGVKEAGRGLRGLKWDGVPDL